jgi:hypothetical protein
LLHNFRIGYAVWLIKKIARENEGKNVEIKIMYDIACLLKKHLRVIFPSYIVLRIYFVEFNSINIVSCVLSFIGMWPRKFA